MALQVSTLSVVFTYDDVRAISSSTRANGAATGSVTLSVQVRSRVKIVMEKYRDWY